MLLMQTDLPMTVLPAIRGGIFARSSMFIRRFAAGILARGKEV